jgi:hypothetical protein
VSRPLVKVITYLPAALPPDTPVTPVTVVVKVFINLLFIVALKSYKLVATASKKLVLSGPIMKF